MSEKTPLPPPGLPGRQLGSSYLGFPARPAPPAWTSHLVRVVLALLAIGVTATAVDGYVQGADAGENGKGESWCLTAGALEDPQFGIAWRWGCWAGADDDGESGIPAPLPSITPMNP
ncbi:hypothetical protein ACIGBH_22570 [Streptomyces sp. NPDC085929]|uniref:hypothetical protein n=1 Tax=Streptomyces sp. NPDC085929 TaxID=3365739 RepID=UPI0037D97323